MNNGCYALCGCSCASDYSAFDNIAQREMRKPIKLEDLCHSNIMWYFDRSTGYSGLSEWGIKPDSGLYILWHKNEYCDEHSMFHMKALYVGKGAVLSRLKKHWLSKDTSEEMLVYTTHMEMENRTSKYVEQLILDCYNIPLNRSENKGSGTLCAHFTQGEVD